MFRKINASLLVLTLMASTFASGDDRYLGVNFGLAPSKTVLGGFFSWGRNQINVGTEAALYTFEEGFLLAQPTITYNRYLTDNGFYASAGLIANYLANQDHEVYERATLPDTGWVYRNVDDPDWKMPWTVIGFGKDFRWTHWGVNVEGDLITPFGEGLAKRWHYWLGAGVSYRFKLE